MAKEFFISPTTSYSCGSKAVLTISGESGVDVVITYPDTTTIARTVTPDSKITLNAGQSITTTNGLISGIEIEKEIDAAPLTVQAKIGSIEFFVVPEQNGQFLPIYDGNGFPNFADRPVYLPGQPELFPDTPEEQLLWLQEQNQLATENLSNSYNPFNAIASTVIGDTVHIGGESGGRATVDYVGGEIVLPSVVGSGGDFVNYSATCLFEQSGGDPGVAFFGILPSGAYPSTIDPLGSYPHLFLNDDDGIAPVMVFYPYYAVYDADLPVELNAQGNLDLDFYLTTETDPYNGMRLPKPGFGGVLTRHDAPGMISQSTLAWKTTRFVGHKHTINNPIIYIRTYSTVISGETVQLYYLVFANGITSTTRFDLPPDDTGLVEDHLMPCYPIDLPYRSEAGSRIVYDQGELSNYTPYLPLLAYYLDQDRAQEFFGNQYYLSTIFTPSLRTGIPDGENAYTIYDIAVMPLQSVYDRNTRVFDADVQTPQDVIDKFPEYIELPFFTYEHPSPGLGIVDVDPLRYLPDLSSDLYQSGFSVTATGAALLDGDSYPVIAAYTNDGSVFVYRDGNPGAAGRLDSVFGRGAKAKVHCIGLNKDKTEFILISDNGIVATSADGITWTGQDISYLTGGKSIRAIAGDYAVGDSGLILRNGAEGWRRVTLDPIPSNFSRINLTVCEYVTDSHYVIGGTNGFVAVIPV
jgi:hypothetical protein